MDMPSTSIDPLNNGKKEFGNRLPSYAETRSALAKLKFDGMQEDRSFIEKRYEVQIEFAHMGTTSDDFMILKRSSAIIDKYAPMMKNLRKDLAKLPPVLWKKLKIDKIIFSDELSTRWGGVRSAAAVHEYSTTMYLAKNYPFFHEIFHRVDTFMPGQGFTSAQISVDAFMSGDPQIKEEYAKAEKSNEKWRNLGKSVEEDSVDENQANYCARLFNQDSDWFSRHKEPGKSVEMKAILLEWSDGLLDERYWNDLKSHKITEAYWPDRFKSEKQ